MGKPILCLDFDGVCHSYVSGWKGADVIPDPPVSGMWDFILSAIADFEVHIFSSRSNQEGGLDAMKVWFINSYVHHINNHLSPNQEAIDRVHATPIVTAMLRFPLEKPPAVVGLDDRVLTFEGTWPSVESLKTFQPWNKREAKAQQP